MFDRPMLILPMPDGMRGYNSFSSMSTLLIVGFALFIYLDMRYGIDNVLGKSKVQEHSQQVLPAQKTSVDDEAVLVNYDARPENVAPKHVEIPLPPPPVSPAVQKAAQKTVALTQTSQHYLRVITDNTRVRAMPDITAGKVLEVLDINERVVYVNHSDFTETFRNDAGQDVTNHWFCIFRPKTGTYGWVHPVNLQAL